MPWWYKKGALALWLYPLSLFFLGVVVVRRRLYRLGVLKSITVNAPVVVVGNITAGGTGKTPLVEYLAKRLSAEGYSPAIITRGYKGKSPHWPIKVTENSDPTQVGDEAVLLASRSGCPVYAGPDRVASANLALSQSNSPKFVILSDDGLQHYRLARDIELCVMDGLRQTGNGFMLPAGPLREPRSRLEQADILIAHGGKVQEGEVFSMKLQGDRLTSLFDRAKTQPMSTWREKTVHALAGIGHPERFFISLEARGLRVIRHPFPDHHRFIQQDISFGDNLPVIMTEKDAVKCRAFASTQHWYLPVEVMLDEAVFEKLKIRLERVMKKKRDGDHG